MAGLLELNQVGKREMLADTITIADHRERPIIAMIPKGPKLTNTLMRWQADSYEDPDISGIIDGKDVESFEDAGKNRQELMNYCQKRRRTAKVSEMAEDVSNVAGAPSGELARSVDKKLEELGRDLEAIIGSDNDAAVGTANSGYKTRGLGSWIQNSAQSVLPVPATFRTPTASIDSTATASLTEALFKAVLKSIYQQRGKAQDLILVCGTALKTAITDFTQFRGSSTNTYGTLRTYTQELSGKKMTSNITLYEGDFNMVKLVPSLLLAAGQSEAIRMARGYVLDMDLLELCWSKMPQVKRLPDLDGGPRALVKAIFGLKVLNPLGLGKFAATS